MDDSVLLTAENIESVVATLELGRSLIGESEYNR